MITLRDKIITLKTFFKYNEYRDQVAINLNVKIRFPKIYIQT